MLQVYIQAGRTELLKATTAEDVHRASSYFSEAFSDALDKLRSSSEAQTSSSEDTADESSDKGDGPGWDVMILHEDSATEKAEEVAKVLREACGLRVTRMEEDCPPGRFVLDSLCWTMNRCRQVCFEGIKTRTIDLKIIIIMVIIIISLIYIAQFDTNGILTALYIVIKNIQKQYMHI